MSCHFHFIINLVISCGSHNWVRKHCTDHTWNNNLMASIRNQCAITAYSIHSCLISSKYLWVIWPDIKFSQSSLKGSVWMINLVLLVLSGLVMAIRAKKEWGLWFLAPHHSQLVASLHPSYMAAELIVCLVVWMIKLLWATGWEGRTWLTSIYMQGGFLILPRPLENQLCALFIGQSSAFQCGKSNSHRNITIDSRIQRAIIQLIMHSFCLQL